MIKQQVAVEQVVWTAMSKVADVDRSICFPIYLFIIYLGTNYTVKVT